MNEILDAGPELDALVAREVMGWDAFGHDELWHEKGKRKTHVTRWGTPHAQDCTTNFLWRPSVNMASAWEVVEVLRRRFGNVSVVGIDDPDAPGLPGEHSDSTYWECIVGDDRFYASAGTAPLAVCRAALKAVGRP